MIKFLDDHAGILSAIAIGLTITFEGCNLYFANLGPAQITVAVGSVAELHPKPYIGLNVSARNSGASEGDITRGTLIYDGKELKLVMQAIERATWTYTDPPTEQPPRFALFAPIVLGKDETSMASLWFELNTNSPLFDTPGRRTLTLNLYGQNLASPAATTTFYINLTKANIDDIYDPNRKTATLPVPVIY